jgi:small subunit ribosomal protein S2
MAIQANLKDLLEAGAHFGHQSRRWNPKMEEYLHGVQDGVHIFDLIKTKELFDEALEAIETASRQNKKILLVGTKKQAKEKVAKVAKEAGIYYVNERWLGGTLTNFDMIRKSIKKLKDMKEKMSKGEYKSFTKKERLLIEREIDRLERFFGGIAALDSVPDMLVIIDIKREFGAVVEAESMGIETVAVVDTNCDPTLVDYPIPMNDDATRCVEYALDLVKQAILAGKKKGSESSKGSTSSSDTKSKDNKKSSKGKAVSSKSSTDAKGKKKTKTKAKKVSKKAKKS